MNAARNAGSKRPRHKRDAQGAQSPSGKRPTGDRHGDPMPATGKNDAGGPSASGPARGRRAQGRKSADGAPHSPEGPPPAQRPPRRTSAPRHGIEPASGAPQARASGRPVRPGRDIERTDPARERATGARQRTGARAATPKSSAEKAPAEAPPAQVPERLTGYLAPPGLEAEVLREVGPPWHQHGRLILCAGPPRPSVWAQDVWLTPRHEVVESIGAAARALRAVQRNWVPYGEVHHRRLALVASKLPPIKARTWPFPTALPDAALGAYTLLTPHRLLYSATRSSPFPHGEIEFDEDREGPPSRAYRKLWEVFTLLQEHPRAGERCIDMGASPGGWTWVLATLGADVTSVDKAPLAPAVAALPNVHSRVGSAFALRAEHHSREPFDWFFSDVICYPARLLTMVQQWLAAGAAKRFVCTIKFQAETDHDTVAAFAAIPGSRLMHLSHNRHELTWIKL